MNDETLPVPALRPSRSAPRRPWVLHDANGGEVRNHQGHARRFTSKEAAERWVAKSWQRERAAVAATQQARQ